MNANDLDVLFDHDDCANRRLFNVIVQLTPEEFTRSVAGSYGSIRNTMVHALSAEAGWLDRCGGVKRGPRLNPADFPTVDSVVRAWSRVEVHVREFLRTLRDDDLARQCEYSFDPPTMHTGRLGDLMQHAATHAVHHRGQVALLLRLLGHAPGNFDRLYYDEEHRGGPAS